MLSHINNNNMNNDNTITKIKNKLYSIIIENNYTKLFKFIEDNKFLLYEEKEILKQGLIQSIENESDKCISEYLINNINNINFETEEGKIPLFLAVEKANFYIANLLLNKQANINYLNGNKDNLLTFLF